MCCLNDTDGGSPSSISEDRGVVLKESLTLLSKWSWNSPCNLGWLVTQASLGLGLSCLPRSPEARFASFQRLLLKVYEQNKQNKFGRTSWRASFSGEHAGRWSQALFWRLALFWGKFRNVLSSPSDRSIAWSFPLLKPHRQLWKPFWKPPFSAGRLAKK